MTPRVCIPAVLVLLAAVGWLAYPPHPATDHEISDLAVQQMRDDGTVSPALDARQRADRAMDWIVPMTLAILSAAAIVAVVSTARCRDRIRGGP